MSAVPRLSAKERQILDLLTEHGELFGLQMVHLTAGGLKRGTVYVTLGRMEDKGYVESIQETVAPGAIGLPRRLYRASALGRRVRQAWQHAERSFAAGQARHA